MAVVALVLARPALGTNLVGTAAVALGLAVRGWAAGLLVKGGELCTAGPYRHVRHPLYLGSLLGAAGFCVMMNIVWGWVIVLPLFLLIYAAQVVAEERSLRGHYGDTYERWAREVPMLVPRLRGRPAGSSTRWRWSQFLVNREQYHMVVTLLLVALFYLRAHWPVGGP